MEKEKRLILVIANKLYGLCCEDVGELFVHPQRGFTTAHMSDTTDAIDNGVAVLRIRIEAQELGIFVACRSITDFFRIADRDGIRRVRRLP